MSTQGSSYTDTQQRALSDLMADSGAYARFPERMTLGRLSTEYSPTVARALDLVARAEASDNDRFGGAARHTSFTELSAALGDLRGSETAVVRACIDRCLKKLRTAEPHNGVHQAQVWRLAASGTPDSVVSLFRVALDPGFPVSPETRRHASLALSCHRLPLSAGLVLKAALHLQNSSLPPEHKEAVITGLVRGVALRIASVISAALSTGEPQVNVACKTGKFHHLTLAKKMIQQASSLALRHKMIEEIGMISSPLFLGSHPLTPGSIFASTYLRMPPYMVDLLRIAVNLPDPFAQRAAVRAIQPTYREGSGHEGTFLAEVLAGRIGGVAARAEAGQFLAQFPVKHQTEVKRAVRALIAAR